MSNIFRGLFLRHPAKVVFIFLFVFWYAGASAWLASSPASGFSAFVDFLAPVALFAVFLFLVLLRRARENSGRILSMSLQFAFWYAVVHAALFATLGAFAYYQNEISPAPLPKVTISNGERTLVFRTMAHVATPEFYEWVRADIEAAKRDGYWYAYEGVRPGSPESQAEFDRMLGMDFDRDFYGELGKFAGLAAQTDFEFTGLVNDRDVNIDTDLDTVVRRIRERAASGATAGSGLVATSSGSAAPVDFALFSREVEKLSPRELELFRYFNRALLNFTLKMESLPESLMAADPRYADLFAVILDERDEHIVKGILENPEKKLFLTYGLMHFDGVYARLKKSDPKYAIVKIEPYYPLVGRE